MEQINTQHTITMRPYRESDRNGIEDIISATWALEPDGQENDGYISDHYSECFLSSVLMNPTFTRVAEVDGHVAGIVTGSIHHREHRCLKECMRLIRHSVPLIFSRRGINLLRYAIAYTRHDRRLMKNAGKKYEAALTLFILDKKYRGMGIGGKLYRWAQEQFRKEGVKEFSIVTDDCCSYRFYEHAGASLKSQLHFSCSYSDGTSDEMEMFLYESPTENAQ